jgi:hypothetical protein
MLVTLDPELFAMDIVKVLKKQWDRVIALALTVTGAVFLISGWVGVSGTAVLSEQSPYMVSGGLGGIFLLGVGATLWISADLRDEWRKLDRIEQALGEGVLRYDTPSEKASNAVANGVAQRPQSAARAPRVAVEVASSDA